MNAPHVPGAFVPFQDSPPLAPVEDERTVSASHIDDWLEIKMAMHDRIERAEKNAALLRKMDMPGADYWDAIARRCLVLRDAVQWEPAR